MNIFGEIPPFRRFIGGIADGSVLPLETRREVVYVCEDYITGYIGIVEEWEEGAEAYRCK